MFDYLRSSYDLGEQFTNVLLQTKDIEDGIGGTMTNYWISPDGYLHLIDYYHTADFVELKEGDDGYNDKMSLFNFQWIPNGTHGKVRVHPITKYIEIYPEKWEGKWELWPLCRIHLINGKIQDFMVMGRSK
jgi:hypothetical protein